MNRKITIFFLIVIITSCFGMNNIEVTNRVQNTAIRWNCEIYNKSNAPATVLIGNKIKNNSLIMEYLDTVSPMKKVRTTINRAFPLIVEIQNNNQKITEVFVQPCVPHRPCSRTVFLTLDMDGLRPQTGQWYGRKGVTDSELDITQNITWEQLSHDWNNFAMKNRHLFQNKVYVSQQYDQSMYQKAKEALQGSYDAAKERVGELWYGKQLDQEQIAEYKKQITDIADDLLSRANAITDPSFKKLTAQAIVNKWKRESIAALDQVKVTDDVQAIYDNFIAKTANQKRLIEAAERK